VSGIRTHDFTLKWLPVISSMLFVNIKPTTLHFYDYQVVSCMYTICQHWTQSVQNEITGPSSVPSHYSFFKLFLMLNDNFGKNLKRVSNSWLQLISGTWSQSCCQITGIRLFSVLNCGKWGIKLNQSLRIVSANWCSKHFSASWWLTVTWGQCCKTFCRFLMVTWRSVGLDFENLTD